MCSGRIVATTASQELHKSENADTSASASAESDASERNIRLESPVDPEVEKGTSTTPEPPPEQPFSREKRTHHQVRKDTVI
jgi:hypothetical protein